MGGRDLLVDVMEECMRVSREGGIFLVPLDWPEQIAKGGYAVKQLTNEVSRGLSDNPVCYIKVTNTQEGT